MKDFYTYEEEIKKNEHLKNSIRKLIEFISTEKKFRFEKNELIFNSDLLESNSIIETSDTKFFEISNLAIFFSEFFNYYAAKQSYMLSSNIENANNFIENVNKELKAKNHDLGINSFFSRFRRFVYLAINKELKTDFTEYVKKLSKTKSWQLHSFIHSYCRILPFLDVEVKTIYNNFKHLTAQISDPSLGYNSDLSEIRNAVVLLTKSDISKGRTLLKISFGDDPVIENIASAIIQGIYEVERDLFWDEIIVFSKNKDYHISILLALTIAGPINRKEVKSHFDLITSFEDDEIIILYNFSQFYQRLINSNVSDTEQKLQVLSKLEELILHSNQMVRRNAISSLASVNNYDDERIELVKKLIHTSDFDKEQIGLIAHIFMTNKSLNGFFEILEIYFTKYPFNFNPRIFSSAFYHFNNDQKADLCKMVIKFLTHDKGELRYLGNRIIYHLAPHNGRYVFNIDILQFDALTQYKLWASVLAEEKEPHDVLPMLLPLLNSSYSFVQEAFICRIEEYTKAYGKSVLETLESELDLNNTHYESIYQRIQNYNNMFQDEISKKYIIKEFNPLYTQASLYRIYTSNFGESMNKAISENTEKCNTFLQFSSTVVLAKGGGWKPEKKGAVSKLSQISSSFQLPRSYFIEPEYFDKRVRLFYSENWENKFKEWEAIISS